MKYDEKIQLIIVGESCVGKTSLLFQYTKKKFSTQHLATMGLEYFYKEERINDKLFNIKIWDTAGQEQYKSLTKNFYRNSDGVIIVYDVTSRSTFEKVQEWVHSISEYTDSEKNVQKILVGNKIDLPRQVSEEEGKKLADLYNIPFFEASAKENIGVDEFMKKIIEDSVLNVIASRKGIELNKGNNSPQKEGCSC